MTKRSILLYALTVGAVLVADCLADWTGADAGALDLTTLACLGLDLALVIGFAAFTARALAPGRAGAGSPDARSQP